MTRAAPSTAWRRATDMVSPAAAVRRWTGWFALAACALLSACAQLPYRAAAGPITDVSWDAAVPSATALSPVYATPRARRDVAERVWQLLNDRYHDPSFNGVNWAEVRARRVPQAIAARSDVALYAALKAMAAELRDPHTEVLTAREAIDLRQFVAPRNGVTLSVIDGRLAVLEVEPDTPGAAAGLRAGDAVLAINDAMITPAFLSAAAADPDTELSRPLAGDGPEALPADAVDAARVRAMRAVRRLLRSQAPAAEVPSARPPPAQLSMRLVIERPPAVDALQVTVVAAPRARPPQAHLRWLDGQVAVIGFNRFHPSVRDEIERALDAAAGARGVILDLRGNGGGLLEMYRWLVGRFMADERVPMRTITRSRVYPGARSVDDLVVTPHRTPLLQPLAVLIDGRTASSAELAAVTLAEQRAAVLVGEPTCGCAVAVRVEYVLPDGGGLRIAETSFLSARGASMQDAPTLPHLRVSPTLEDLRAGRDVVLAEAHRRLLDRVTMSKALPNR